MNIFWNTIASYNSATWPCQLILVLAGIILTSRLISRPDRWVKLGIKAYFIVLYLWISVVYYHIYCAERSYHNVMSIFWGVLAAAWIWDMITGYTEFRAEHKYKLLSYFLLLTPFVYPLFSLARGLSFPGITSPVMPCSVVVYTIGVLLLTSRKVNLFIILLLCHWALIGLSKTYFFRIPEDFLLASAAVPAIYLFFREYFLRDLHTRTKPNARFINWILITLCVWVVLILMGCMFFELLKDS